MINDFNNEANEGGNAINVKLEDMEYFNQTPSPTIEQPTFNVNFNDANKPLNFKRVPISKKSVLSGCRRRKLYCPRQRSPICLPTRNDRDSENNNETRLRKLAEELKAQILGSVTIILDQFVDKCRSEVVKQKSVTQNFSRFASPIYENFDNEANIKSSSDEDELCDKSNEEIASGLRYLDFVKLPTTVAITNPSLQESRVLLPSFKRDFESLNYPAMDINTHVLNSDIRYQKESRVSLLPVDPANYKTPPNCLHKAYLRKAKLMFFWVRYPSSAVLKTYFPDIKFNKNNTAQLVKWFSNFREYYYKQIESCARKLVSETTDENCTILSTDSEIFKIFQGHYIHNNVIQIPPGFYTVVERTLLEFFRAIQGGKDTEQSWKKSIYKVISRLDGPVPECFKTQQFLDKLMA